MRIQTHTHTYTHTHTHAHTHSQTHTHTHTCICAHTHTSTGIMYDTDSMAGTMEMKASVFFKYYYYSLGCNCLPPECVRPASAAPAVRAHGGQPASGLPPQLPGFPHLAPYPAGRQDHDLPGSRWANCQSALTCPLFQLVSPSGFTQSLRVFESLGKMG